MTLEERVDRIELALIKAGLMEPPPYTLDEKKAAFAGDRKAIRKMLAFERMNRNRNPPATNRNVNRQ